MDINQEYILFNNLQNKLEKDFMSGKIFLLIAKIAQQRHIVNLQKTLFHRLCQKIDNCNSGTAIVLLKIGF